MFRASRHAALLARTLFLLTLTLLPGLALAQRICVDRDVIVFGDRPVGSSTIVTVTVSNCGTAPFSFTDVSVHPSTGPAFRVRSGCVTGAALQPGEACTADVEFAPTIAGQESGGLWLRNTTITPSQLITFYGRGMTSAAGTSTLAFAPSPLQFGDTPPGSTSASIRLDLQNRGSVAITPSALVVNGPDAYDFNGTGDCAVGHAIPAGGSCHLDMVFTPQALGTRVANLIVDAPQLASLAILQITGTGAVAVDANPAVDIVEFRHTELDHYFLTAEPAEVDFIDRGGLGPAWVRTGRHLRGWPAGAAAPQAEAVAACRFFGTPGLGPDSHFYTVDAGECAAVKQDPYWTFEGLAFRVLPLVGGGCGSGADVVQRLFKPAADVTGIRHRYVISGDDVAAMLAAGWVLEGPVFCSVR